MLFIQQTLCCWIINQSHIRGRCLMVEIDMLHALLNADLIFSVRILFVIHLLLLVHPYRQPLVFPGELLPMSFGLDGLDWHFIYETSLSYADDHSVPSPHPPLTLTFPAHPTVIIRSTVAHLIDSSYWHWRVNRSVHYLPYTTCTGVVLHIKWKLSTVLPLSNHSNSS